MGLGRARTAALVAACLLLCSCAHTDARGGAPRSPDPALNGPKIDVEVTGRRLLVDGQEVSGDEASIRRALSRPGWGETVVVLRGTAEPDEVTLAGVLRNATGTLVKRLLLEVDELRLDITLRRTDHPETKPRMTLAISMIQGTGTALSVDNSSAVFSELGEWQVGDATSEAGAAKRVAQVCEPGACHVSIDIYPGGSFIAALKSWKRVQPAVPRSLFVSLPSVSSREGASAAGAQQTPRTSTKTSVAGRLPPGVIQAIVRASFGKFRTCYEAGLGRNSELSGKVSARFVIGREGRVTNVADGGSDLADADVRACVLKAFYELRFPEPDGGIVTVVYPIFLAPD